MPDFNQTFFDYLNMVKAQMKAQPLILGGVGGTGGGGGGPSGGFIGVLPQKRVAYDSTEAESNATISGGTLVDNLNHIRYRINILEDNYIMGDGIAKITVAASEPSTPSVGDLWVDIS